MTFDEDGEPLTVGEDIYMCHDCGWHWCCVEPDISSECPSCYSGAIENMHEEEIDIF